MTTISLEVVTISKQTVKTFPDSVEEKGDGKQFIIDRLVPIAIILAFCGIFVIYLWNSMRGWEGRVVGTYVIEYGDGDGGTIKEYCIRVDPGGTKKLPYKTWKLFKHGDYIIKLSGSNDYIYGKDKIGILEQAGFHEKAMSIVPKYASGWHEQGVILMKRKRYEDAIYRFNKAINTHRSMSYGIAWYNKGLALIGLRRYEDAKKCFKKAEELNYSTTWQQRNELDHDEYEWLGRDEDEGVIAPCEKCHEN